MIAYAAGILTGWAFAHPTVRAFFAIKFAEWLAAARARWWSK